MDADQGLHLFLGAVFVPACLRGSTLRSAQTVQSPTMLDPTHARGRQQRLMREMEAVRLDAVVVGAPEHVYYLSTHRAHVLQQSAFVLWSDGRSWLVTANEPATGVAADDVAAYSAN